MGGSGLGAAILDCGKISLSGLTNDYGVTIVIIWRLR